jgi:hypothetical protein
VADVEDLKIVFRAEVDKAISDLKKASKAGKESSKDWDSIAKNFTTSAKQSLSLSNAFGQLSMQVAGGIGIYALASKSIEAMGKFASESVREYQDAAEANSRLAAQVRATGGAAGYTASELAEMADKLQDATLIDGEDIKSAESALLKFTSISGQNFEDATRLALDLSKVLETDTSSAAQTLGKALEAPAEGLSALKKAGVVLSDSQEKLVKQFVASGDAASAQALILKEVEARVGGVAAAIAKDDPGGLKRLSLAMKDLKEEAGRGFTQSMSGVTSLLADLASKATEAAARTNDLRAARAGSKDQEVITSAIAELKRQQEALETQKSFLGSALAGDPIYTVLVAKKLATLNSETVALQARLRLLQETALAERNAAKSTTKSSTAEPSDDDKAAAHIAEVDAALQKQVNSIILKSQATGEAVDTQALLNTYTDAYVKLIGESNGLVSEKNGWSKGYAEVIQYLSGSLDEAAEVTRKKTAADKEAEAVASRIEGLYKDTPEGIAAAKAETLAFAQAQLTVAETSGASAEEIAKLKAIIESLPVEISKTDKILNSFHDDLIKAMDQALAQSMVNGFEAIGEALTTGENAADSFGTAMAKMAADLLKQTSLLAMTAGLRMLAELGVAGIPLALGLFAIAGVSAIAGGAISGAMAGTRTVDYDQYIVDPVIEAEKKLAEQRLEILEDELEREEEIRDAKLKELESYFDTEYEVLKDQWQRGLITTEEYRSSSSALRGREATEEAAAEAPYEEAKAAKEAEEARQKAEEEALIEARTKKLSELASQAKTLQDELNGMSGWDKFWSGRDEEITKTLSSIDRRITVVQNADTVNAVLAAKNGADFITDGPQMLLVGDNASGAEHVRVEPAPFSAQGSLSSGSGGVSITINGPIYGVDDLYLKLEAAGKRLTRYGRTSGEAVS